MEIFDQSNDVYEINKDIRFKIPQLKSYLCDFNDAYIVLTGKITATIPDDDDDDDDDDSDGDDDDGV